MTRRSPAAVFFLPIITFGIYGLVWLVKTKGEMVRLGADIPTSWLLIVPFANIYYMWKWSQGVEHVTRGQSSAGVTFLLIFLLSIIGYAITQSSLNSQAPAAGGGGYAQQGYAALPQQGGGYTAPGYAPPPQGGYAPPPQGGYAPPPAGQQGYAPPPPQGGYAPPPPPAPDQGYPPPPVGQV